MNPATARPWAREAVRSLVRNQVGNSIAVHNLSNKVSPLSASTLELQPMKSTVGQARATASNTSRTALTPSVKVSVRSRSMSTTSGKDKAEPGIMFGFGRRQKPAGSEKIGLGKGHDLMEDDPGARKKVVISGYDSNGFQLQDGVDVRSSIICLPNLYVLWEPKRSADITIESLRLLELLAPKIDLLILGVGERITKKLDPALIKYLRSKGISVEQMDTVNACSTFNVLNAEDRRVAAALIQLAGDEEK